MKNKPRQKHYILGHEAFRLFAENQPEPFFSLMASNDHKIFINDLINQINTNYPQDSSQLNADDLSVSIFAPNQQPLVVIKMPPVEAYCECIFVGILANFKFNSDNFSNSSNSSNKTISCYTLEKAKGNHGDVSLFCQWNKDMHVVIAEIGSKISADSFALLIEQQINH